jgi:site-specific recombinase XerD
MFLSKRSNGIYYLWIDDELGRRHKVSTRCTLKTDALKFLQDFKQSEHERKVKLQRVSLHQFTEDYLTYSRGAHTAKSRESASTSLREFLRIVGDLPLHKIGVREIEQFLAIKIGEASEQTARTYFVTLASAFETAKRWNCVSSNPFRLVEKPKIREIQPAYFSKDDFITLLKTVEDVNLKELYICAVSTGMRLSELSALQWTSVDFVRKAIFVQNSESFTTKTKRNRVVPMSEQLWRLMATRKEVATCELVFRKNGRRLTKDEVSKGFKKHICAIGLDKKLHSHSRHTFTTWLVQEGVPIYEVQKLLGHSSLGMTQKYAHLAGGDLHSAVNEIRCTKDRRVFSIQERNDYSLIYSCLNCWSIFISYLTRTLITQWHRLTSVEPRDGLTRTNEATKGEGLLYL